MYSSGFIHCILLFLVVIVTIDTQRRFRTEFDVPEEDDYLPSITQGRKGPNECNCIPIRRCDSLRNRTDWRTAGETCFGHGDFRGVCCPETSNDIDGECGLSRDQSYPDSFIVKGENASEGSWPWMVSIGYKNSSGVFTHWCSGFLIDRKHVISAARCELERLKSLTARIGNVNQEEADEYRITGFTVHPDYKKGFFHDDIVVITLDREVNSPSFNPVCLPDQEVVKMNMAGRVATVVGWGSPIPSKRNVQTNLKYWTGLRVLSNRRCEAIFIRNVKTSFNFEFPGGISKEMLCAGYADGGYDICPTFGSPLMVQNGNRWFAVGSVSFGWKCGRPGLPDGFANITNYLDWIRENTKD